MSTLFITLPSISDMLLEIAYTGGIVLHFSGAHGIFLDNFAGAKTTYEEVYGATLETALQQQNNILPANFKNAEFCEDFEFRAKCAARTWLRPHPQEHLMCVCKAPPFYC